MVVHGDRLNILTVPFVRMSDRESKFLIVNNHVREIPIQYEVNSTCNHENSEERSSNNADKRMKRKLNKKKITGYFNVNKSDVDSENRIHEDTKISESDLEELRTVYRKCKSVMKKIEMKYGHLLDLNEDSSSKQQKRKLIESIEECQCVKNKKIVFNDDGHQIAVETRIDSHICPKKTEDNKKHQNIEIQYTEDEIHLPDKLEDLLKLLQNPHIENTFRHQVIYKIKSMKEEVSNEIKFNKHYLIEKLKSNPDEMLDFKGTNLASLPGYT